MAQIFDAPSKAILRSQIAEHIAETDKNDKRELQAGEEPLPNDRFFDRELSWLKFNKRAYSLCGDSTTCKWATGSMHFVRILCFPSRARNWRP